MEIPNREHCSHGDGNTSLASHQVLHHLRCSSQFSICHCAPQMPCCFGIASVGVVAAGSRQRKSRQPLAALDVPGGVLKKNSQDSYPSYQNQPETSGKWPMFLRETVTWNHFPRFPMILGSTGNPPSKASTCCTLCWWLGGLPLCFVWTLWLIKVDYSDWWLPSSIRNQWISIVLFNMNLICSHVSHFRSFKFLFLKVLSNSFFTPTPQLLVDNDSWIPKVRRTSTSMQRDRNWRLAKEDQSNFACFGLHSSILCSKNGWNKRIPLVFFQPC